MQLNKLLGAAVAAILCATAASAEQVAQKASGDRTDVIRQALQGGRAKNVILFIGDGMGDSEITIARNYQVGAAGRLALDSLPFTGEYTTYAVEETDPTLPNYVTDSAASGTGWATGQKTSNGRISSIAGSTTVSPLTTILERAKAAGYLTGDVSTAELTDATPAVLASHINDRGCQGPANMANCVIYKKSVGGPGSIAEQMIDQQVDVLLGGGRARFAQLIDGGPHLGKSVVESAQAQGYRYVSTAAEMQKLVPGQRVLGLFNDGNMSLEWSGEFASATGTGPQRCIEAQRPASEPALVEMTRKAIKLLNRPQHSQKGKGFFLQVEGASIDKQDHASNPCGQIGETVAFDRAIHAALDFAKANPDTLIVVTADHGHTSQIMEPVSDPSNHPGAFSVLLTHDNAEMTINYATEPVGASQSHTGTEVRIAAQGPQSANVLGITNQTDLYHTMARALGLE